MVKSVDGETRAEGLKEGQGALYKLQGEPVPPQGQMQVAAATKEGAVNQLELWHARLGHLHEAGLKKMAKDRLVRGLPPDLP